MFLDTLDVKASISNELVKQGTWTIDVSNTDVTPNSANTTIPFHTSSYVTESGLEIDNYYYHVNFATDTIINTEMQYFAYKIVFTPNSISTFKTDALWTRYVIGTSGEVASDKGVYGVQFSKSANPSLWYVTNGAELNLRVALQSYFYNVLVDDEFTKSDFIAKGTVTYKVYAYTKSEYDELQQSIDDGNELQEEGNKLQEEGNKLQEDANDLQKEENETSKGILGQITSFFGSFFQNLIDSVIHIVIPTDEQLNDILASLETFLFPRLGILSFPFELFEDLINIFSFVRYPSLEFPSFSIMGYKIWDSISINLNDNSLASEIFGYVRIGTGIIILSCFLLYVQDFFDKHFGGGSS